MEKNPNTIKTILSEFGLATRRIKIGIAKDVKDRHNDVDAGISGNVILLCEYLVDEAAKVESHLHDIFKDKRYTERGKRGSGKTEFFRLTNKEIRQAKSILQSKELQSNNTTQIICTVIFAIIIIYTIFNQ